MLFLRFSDTKNGVENISWHYRSHTVAYNPNARRAYEKSQHAEDFGRIKINLFL